MSHGTTQSFNPRARDGREIKLLQLASDRAVSIHAPVMDANCTVDL